MLKILEGLIIHYLFSALAKLSQINVNNMSQKLKKKAQAHRLSDAKI